MVISDRLRAIREQKDLSQGDIEQRTGLKRCYVSRVENGEISSRTAIRPITVKVAILANQLRANYSGDPCDHLIGATALVEALPLVTKDRNIRSCKQLQTIW